MQTTDEMTDRRAFGQGISAQWAIWAGSWQRAIKPAVGVGLLGAHGAVDVGGPDWNEATQTHSASGHTTEKDLVFLAVGIDARTDDSSVLDTRRNRFHRRQSPCSWSWSCKFSLISLKL